jgi:AmmeMemoRadiSam system protein B/AmmeMemoRadiSam system protein A
MLAKLLVVLLITGTMITFSQERQADRQPVAAGRFYLANKEALITDIEDLFRNCVKAPSGFNVRAIISPHAGFVFSGKIAASAFNAVPADANYKNIFIIGSSHVMSFNGASVYNSGDYITPLGNIMVNKQIANKLISDNRCFNFPVTSHVQEHSIEVQIPFIQYRFKKEITIVPIIIGTENKNIIKEIATALKPYFIPENLFVISSDFSHYPAYQDAIIADKLTAEAIISKDSENFLKTLRKNSSKGYPGLVTSMCGWTSGLTLLYLAEDNPNLTFKKISYCNSGDSQYGNKDEVVGYNALELIEENKKEDKNESLSDVRFTGEEATKLITLARNSIRSMLFEKKRQELSPDSLPVIFKSKMGAFVTLKIEGKLRGCIGRFPSDDPLYLVVDQMATSSAFEDPRFSPLTSSEFEETEIEISVLGPLKKITNIDEIVLGKHGIYIKKDFRSGTMLPQVATENSWTVEQFLGYTARDKAGLGWTGWKDAEIFIYEAVVLEETKRLKR